MADEKVISSKNEPLLAESSSESKQSLETGEASLTSSIINLVNCLIGSGMLTLPSAFKDAGYINGTVLLALFGLISGISCLCIYDAAKFSGRSAFAGIVEHFFGKAGRKYVDFFQIVYSVGAVIGYLVLVKEQLHISVLLLTRDIEWFPEFLSTRWFLLSVSMVFIILPMSLRKDMHALRFTSGFALILVLYIAGVIAYKAPWASSCSLSDDSYFQCSASSNQCVITPVAREASYFNLTSCKLGCEQYSFEYGIEDIDITEEVFHAKPEPFLLNIATIMSAPLFSFAFNCQVQFSPLVKELSNPTKPRIFTMVFISTMVCMVLYNITAFAGYFSFCNQTLGDILDNYKYDDMWILWGRVALALNMCCSFPLFSHAIRAILHSHFWADEDEMNHKGKITTLLICGITFTCAVIFSNLDTILGLTGAIAATQLLIIIPFALKWKIYRLNRRITVKKQLKDTGLESFGMILSEYLYLFVAVCGVFLGIVSVFAVLHEAN